ncbi:protein YIF1B-B isoform X1 [Hydra vulgaris]|nr:protein YIF1B-B-like [Hydra vulgaris]
MDPPHEYMNSLGSSQRIEKKRNKGQRPQNYMPQQYGYGSSQLFDDISVYGNDPALMQQQNIGFQPQGEFYAGQQFVNDPMANAALHYGSQFVPAGKEFVEKKIDQFISVSKLKYYFAVDNAYVFRKLCLLIFPFSHQDWSLKYDKSEPIAPRYEINAPDLYIPTMAFVTYVLVNGFIMGTQNRFTPEQLGMTASSALVWLFVELIMIIVSMYVIGILSNVKYLDLFALCGYKYVGMILSCIAGLLFNSFGYYMVLSWMSFAIAFYLARTLRLIISPNEQSDSLARSSGTKRRLYVLVFISLIQPLFMYFLTRHLFNYDIVQKIVLV